MGLSRRAKRGIAIFNKINETPNRWRYRAKRTRISPPTLPANILDAANQAMAALPEEMRNAYVPELSIKQDDSQPEKPEVGTQQSVYDQQENGQETKEGTPGGPSCGNC